jgi:MerR family transcriptional regulator, copper efflux regulator
MRIGALAERTGTSVPTIRYYEEIGLLRQVARRGGQRIYDHEDAHRLAFIRRCRDFDFSILETRSLLSLMQNGTPCGEARKLAEGHLGELRKKLGELWRWSGPSPRWSPHVLRPATAVPRRIA